MGKYLETRLPYKMHADDILGETIRDQTIETIYQIFLIGGEDEHTADYTLTQFIDGEAMLTDLINGTIYTNNRALYELALLRRQEKE